jgi:KaiC/GvpD/RAD55 family RecA-like ATPase
MRHIYSIALIFIFYACHPVQRSLDRNEMTQLLQSQKRVSSILNQFVAQNDSLLNNGFYSKGYSSGIDKEIRSLLLKSDSSLNVIYSLYRKVNFRIAYEEEYHEIRKKINVTRVNFSANNQWEQNIQRIRKKMTESDLVGEKKALVTILDKAEEKKEQAVKRSGQVENYKSSVLKTGNISPSASAEIDTRLKIYRGELDTLSVQISELRGQVEDNAYFGKNLNTIKSRILLFDSVVNEKINYQLYVFRLIEDGLSKSKRNMFNMAAFFGPGGYLIPSDKYDLAEKYFGVILDSLMQFSNSYPNVYRKAQIAVIGYADGTNIGIKSPVYSVIKKILDKSNPIKQELNQGLSLLRAAEIAKFMEGLVKKRGSQFINFDKIVFEILESGEGENFPDPDINDYKTNDERRRIVMIYWSLVPLK